MILVAYQNLSFTFSIENLISWVSFVLMYIGVVYLVINKSLFASYVIIFILYFSNAFSNFFSSFINITFNPFEIIVSSDLMLYVSLLIFIYLAFMVVSYVVNGVKSRTMKGKVGTLTLVFFGFLWLFLGFNAALVIFPIVGIAFLFGNDKASLLMIISYLIMFIYQSVSVIFSAFELNILILAILEVLLIVYAVKLAIPRFFPKKV